MSHNISRLELDSLGKASVALAKGRGAGRTMYYVGFNMYSPVVGQLKGGKPDKSGAYTAQDSTYLRSAIFYAINPVPFTTQVDIFNGTAIPADQIMHPGLIGYVTDRPAGTTLGEWKEASSYFNADKAKEFFGKLSPAFKAKLTPESVTFIVSNIPERVKMANIIKDQVKTTLGVDLLKVVPMVHAQLIGMGKTGEGYDLFLLRLVHPDPGLGLHLHHLLLGLRRHRHERLALLQRQGPGEHREGPSLGGPRGPQGPPTRPPRSSSSRTSPTCPSCTRTSSSATTRASAISKGTSSGPNSSTFTI